MFNPMHPELALALHRERVETAFVVPRCPPRSPRTLAAASAAASA